jgi:hypothetical protein
MNHSKRTHIFHAAFVKAAILGAAFLCSTGGAQAQFSSPVHDVDNAARQPFKYYVDTLVKQNQGGFIDLVTVPAGKRLIVEYVNLFCNDTPGLVQLVDYPNLYFTTGIITVPSVGGIKVNIFASLLKYPINAGSKLALSIGPNPYGNIGCGGVVVGHFVNLP